MKIHDPSDNAWTAQQDEELKLQLANGRSLNEIAIRMKRSPLAVRTRVNKLGIRVVEKD
jgi:DNA-binding CsgD family transcriptional regulator